MLRNVVPKYGRFSLPATLCIYIFGQDRLDQMHLCNFFLWKFCSKLDGAAPKGLKDRFINTFAASYLNTQGLNNSCL